MRTGNDYRHVRGEEDVTATSAGVALSLNTPVHWITTNGDEDLDNLTLADGSVDGERHYISVVAKGHANDTLKVTPTSPGSLTHVTWGTLVVGSCVVLMWDATNAKWQIAGGLGAGWGS
jgi:hypothetical protein